MSTESELEDFDNIFRQVIVLSKVRSQIQNCYFATKVLYDIILQYQGEDFDNIPPEIKTAFIRMYQIFNQARIACEADPDFQYIIKPE